MTIEKHPPHRYKCQADAQEESANLLATGKWTLVYAPTTQYPQHPWLVKLL
jgi:hypothetical protein